MTSPTKAFWRSAFLLVLPTLLLCIVALEISLRIAGHLPSNITDGIFEEYGTVYRLKRNMTKVSRTPSFTCTIHTNAYGLRDRAPGPLSLGPGPYYAFVGDSITFANGVDYEDSFVGVFAETARKKGLGVVNLAIGGHRFTDQEEMLQDFLASVSPKPSRVVVVFTAQFVAGFEERFSDLVVKSGYVFRKDSWRIPYLLVVMGNTSSTYCFFRDAVRKLQARLFPSVSRTAMELLEIFDKRSPATQPGVVQRVEQRLARLDDEIRKSGASPIYVYMPSSADLRAGDLFALASRSADQYDLRLYYNLLRRHCEEAGVPLIDLQPTLEKLQATGVPLSFMQDMHYTAPTNRAIGEALSSFLLSHAPPLDRR